jgi:hypothetical protein
MFIRRTTLALLIAALGSSAAVAAPAKPDSPVHVAANGVFYLCPQLAQNVSPPPKDWIAPLGFQPNSSTNNAVYQFKASDPRGGMFVSFDTSTRRCTLNYVGVGYEQIAGIVRDVVVRSKLVRISGGDEDGAKADVFEGPVPSEPTRIARFIVIENYTQPSTAVDYSERASK